MCAQELCVLCRSYREREKLTQHWPVERMEFDPSGTAARIGSRQWLAIIFYAAPYHRLNATPASANASHDNLLKVKPFHLVSLAQDCVGLEAKYLDAILEFDRFLTHNLTVKDSWGRPFTYQDLCMGYGRCFEAQNEILPMLSRREQFAKHGIQLTSDSAHPFPKFRINSD